MLVPYSQRGGFPIFAGRAYQRGRGFGSIMSSVFRNLIVPAAKNVGKSLLRTGLKKASNVMRGVAEGKNIKQAMIDQIPKSLVAATQGGVQRVRRRERAVRGRAVQRGRAVNGRTATPRTDKRRRLNQRVQPAKRVKRDIFS